nr:mitochondrial transcription rescue factor 1 isoform X2 [Chlorocebus sabaeus]
MESGGAGFFAGLACGCAPSLLPAQSSETRLPAGVAASLPPRPRAPLDPLSPRRRRRRRKGRGAGRGGLEACSPRGHGEGREGLTYSKVEDAFYKGQLRLNEEKLWKKSRTVKVGDTLDLLIGEDKEAGTETVMRILLKKVFEEKTESEKYRVVLRRWKSLKLPKKRTSK